MRAFKLSIAALILCLTAVSAAEAQNLRGRGGEENLRADDEARGTYYAGTVDNERYQAKQPAAPGMAGTQRRQFVDQLVSLLIRLRAMDLVSIFVIGEGWDHLMIVSQAEDQFGNEYRARAYLAGLLPIIRANNLAPQPVAQIAAEASSFLDLAAAMGFTDISVSEGDLFTYHAEISPAR